MEKNKVTFLIPSYRNLQLLQKNLPSWLAELQTGDEILVAEDGGNEENLNFFREKYQLKRVLSTKEKTGQLWQNEIEIEDKKITFSFWQRLTNGRFARNVNDSVQLITSDYFLLINNDVVLTKGVRNNLLHEMQVSKVFAVTAQEIDVNHNNQISGKNKLWWKNGRFWHAKAEDLDQAGSTAWACGGSSLYSTKIWRELGGFDLRYYPAYWEDIDISYQAIRAGYKILYQPKALVEHVHETTNQDVFGNKKMEEMSWRNGSRFSWKNSNWWQKIQFVFFYPWWQVKQFPQLKLWILVLFLALSSKLIFLNTVPNGLTVDEAAIAYNGYAIFTQRRDEWLNKLPVSFRSFGDYKAPLAIYINGFFTGILGREVWVVRLPFVLSSVASIWLMMLIVNLLFKEKKSNHRQYAASIGFLMTIMPWHFHYSRLGFENNLALLLVLLGSYFFLKNMHQKTDIHGTDWSQKWFNKDLLISGLAFGLSLYSYHSTKVVVPLLLIILAIFYHKRLLPRFKILILPIVATIILLLPLAKDSLFGEGLARANSSFIFDENVELPTKIQLLGKGMIAHFSPNFLILGQLNQATDLQDQTLPNVRHGDGVNGVLSWPALFLIAIFLVAMIKFPKLRKEYREVIFWGLTLILLGILPAAMTTQTPHSNQALLALPGFLLIAAAGLASWRYLWTKNLEFYRSMVVFLFVISCIFFLHYQYNYYQIFAPSETTKNMQLKIAVEHFYAENLIPAFKLTRSLEKEVEQIIVATGVEQEYIYALFARGTKPIAYQGGSLSEKYLFLPEVNFGDFNRSNALILVAPNNLKIKDQSIEKFLIKEFKDNRKKVNLQLYRTPKNEE